jgi:hypothetical protein
VKNRNKLWLISSALALSGCATIPNIKACTAAGVLSAGANCAETVTGVTSQMTEDEYFDFLEPQQERPDPSSPGHLLPARGGAICTSSEDFNRLKTEFEKACKKIKCTKEAAQALANLKVISK